MKYFALTLIALIALDFYYMRTLQRDETVLEKWVEATRDLNGSFRHSRMRRRGSAAIF